ncbi:MAG: AAA family ATPase [Anaerolineales bacterium]|jgi:MoxR-like ATPase
MDPEIANQSIVNLTPVQRMARSVRESIAQVIVGKGAAVELLLVALLTPGHVLIEDIPGIGKTTLAKSLARSLGCRFQRIQFTPDLLPSDITGVNVFNQKKTEFEFRAGPIMAQIVLADEINRAGPRTQSALLEAMEERQVTVDGVTYPLPKPFLVLATQNPIEMEGTFPLPEAQVDRFLMRLSLGYPDREEERTILRQRAATDPLEGLSPVVSVEEVSELMIRCRSVYVSPSIEDYLLALVQATREEHSLDLGVSPRGSIALHHTARCLAALRGRAFVVPDDVQTLVLPVLTHRLILSSQARLRGRSAQDILGDVVSRVPVPVEERWSEAKA